MYFFHVFLPPLLNLSCFGKVLNISVLYHVHPCLKYSLDFSNFLEEISIHPHSCIFLYFSSLFIYGGLLFFLCFSLELCIQLGISFLFSLAFYFSFFLSYLQSLLTQPLSFCIFFLWDGFGHWLLHYIRNLCPSSSGTLSDLSPWI